MKKKCIAIIVAAGNGRRMGTDIPKQYMEIGGKPLLAYSLRAFQCCDAVDEIRIVCAEDDVDKCHNLAIDFGIIKLSYILPGGASRQESVFSGLSFVDDDDIILIHDAARPFVSMAQISQVAREAKAADAAILAAPITDTIKRIGEAGIATLPRESLFAAQTPQGFLGRIIKQAHKTAIADGFVGSDDASLVERLGILVNIIPSTQSNMKITTAQDLKFAQFLLDSEGTTYDLF